MITDGLRVNVTGNSAGFDQALTQVKGRARQFANEMSQQVGASWAGAFSLKNLVGGIGGYLGFEALKSHLAGLLQEAGRLKDLSEQFDIPTDEVQAWESATRKAGLSTRNFTMALESLRAARQNARESEGGLAKFRALGIPEATTLGPGSDIALLRQVLESKAGRALKADVLTKRGVVLEAALEHLGKSPITFTAADLKQLDEADIAWRDIKNTISKLSVRFGPGRKMITWSKLLTGDLRGFALETLREIIPGGALMPRPGKMPTISPEFAGTPPGVAGAEVPAVIAARDKAMWEALEKQLDGQRKLRDLERDGMTIQDRKLSIMRELATLELQIKDLQEIGPLSPEGELRLQTLLEARQRYRNELGGLKETAGTAPPTFTPDALARVGLFTKSTLAFNPALGVAQQILVETKGIHRVLREKEGADPWNT